jgi:hypothetical protein
MSEEHDGAMEDRGAAGVQEAELRDQRAAENGHERQGDQQAALFEGEDAQRFRARWESLQGSFVDQPRQAVEQADELVGELMERLTAGFTQRRAELEAQWERGDEASTEDLRVALTRYRSFFNRLLSA